MEPNPEFRHSTHEELYRRLFENEKPAILDAEVIAAAFPDLELFLGGAKPVLGGLDEFPMNELDHERNAEGLLAAFRETDAS